MSETTSGVIAALSVLLLTVGLVMRIRALKRYRVQGAGGPSFANWVFFWQTRDMFSSSDGFRMFCIGTGLILAGAVGTFVVFRVGRLG